MLRVMNGKSEVPSIYPFHILCCWLVVLVPCFQTPPFMCLPLWASQVIPWLLFPLFIVLALEKEISIVKAELQ